MERFMRRLSMGLAETMTRRSLLAWVARGIVALGFAAGRPAWGTPGCDEYPAGNGAGSKCSPGLFCTASVGNGPCSQMEPCKEDKEDGVGACDNTNKTPACPKGRKALAWWACCCNKTVMYCFRCSTPSGDFCKCIYTPGTTC
jgi:hypothetical protein